MEEVGVKLAIEGEADFFSTLDRVNKAIADLGGKSTPGMASFADALNGATKAANNANPAFDGAAKAIGATGTAAQNASGLYQDAAGRWNNSSGQFASDAEKAAAGVDKIPEAARRVPDGLKAAEGGFNAFEEVVTGALRRVGELIVNVGLQGAQAIAGFVQDSIGAAGDFEAGMNQFAAAAGKGFEPGTESLGEFKDLFLSLGKELPVSTLEVQNAATTLIKGGLDPATVRAGALKDSLLFAAAAGMDLDAAAELGIKILGTFGDANMTAAQQTEFLANAQNLLTRTANASTVDVAQLGDAELAAAGMARALGLSHEELTIGLGAIVGNFGSAAEAGTSYKNFLARLQPTTAPATDAMAELGLMTTSTTKIMNFLQDQGIAPLGTDLDTLGNQFTEFAASQGWTAKEITKTWGSFAQSKFFDGITGEYIGNAAAAELLQNATIELTDAEKALALQTIFGNDAMGAASSYANLGGEGIDRFANSVLNANGVQAQADAVQQGLNFQMENFKGSVEALQITIGQALTPVLENLFANVLTPGLGVLIGFADALFGNQEAFAALSPPLQEVVTGLQGAASVFQAIGSALLDAGPMSQEFAESFGLISPALPPLISALQTAASFLTNNWQSAVAIAGGVLTAVLAPGIAAGAVAFAGVLVAAAPVIAILAGIGLAAAALQSAWQQNLGGIQQHTATIMASIQSIIESVMGAVMAFWAENGEEIIAFAQQAWAQVQDIVATTVALVSEILSQLAAYISDNQANIQQIIEGAWQAIQGIIGGALDLIQGIVKTALALLSGDFEGAWEEVQSASAKFVTHLGDVFMGLWKMLEPGIKNAWNQFVKSVDNLGNDVISGIVRGIGESAGKLNDALKNMASNALQAAKDMLKIGSPSRLFAEEVGEPISQGIAMGILAETGAVTAALGKLSKEAVKAVADLADQAGAALEEALSGRVGLIRGQLGANDYLESLYRKQEDAAAKIAEITDANAEIDARLAELAANGGSEADMLDLQRKRGTNTASVNDLYRQYTDLIDLNNRTQTALHEAQARASEIAKTDATAANDYLSLRKNQIAEIAKYEQNVTDASSEGMRERAEANLEAVKRAQALELQQLQNSTTARAKELAAQGDMEKTGNAVVDGIIKGIQARSAELATALGTAMASALDAARTSLGIHSPSLVFAQEVGMPIAEGIGLGIEQAMSNPMAAINSLTSSLVRPAAPAVAGRAGGSNTNVQNWSYSPTYQGSPPSPSQDFAAMRVLATAR